MNIKDYAYIVEIADRRSLTDAANRLCITQSALTKFLQRIEAELGSPLFYRRGKRLVLTPIGQAYVEKGRAIVQMDKSLEDEIQTLRLNGADTIRLGHGMGFAELVLDCILPEYFSKPRTRSVSVHEDSSSRLLQAVENEQMDLCLAYVREFRPALEYTPLRQTKLVLAVPNDSSLLRTAVPREGYPHPVVEDELWLREPYIRMASFTQSGAVAQAYFSRLGKWPNNRLYVENVRNALGAVSNGIGNCILAELPHTKYPVSYLCLPDLDLDGQKICMVTLKGAYPDHSLLELEKTIKKLFHCTE